MQKNDAEWKQLERLALAYYQQRTKEDSHPSIKIKQGIARLWNKGAKKRLGYFYKGRITIFDSGKPTNLNTLLHELGHSARMIFPYFKESIKQYDKDFSYELHSSKGIDEAIAISFNEEALQFIKETIGDEDGYAAIINKAQDEFNERNLRPLPQCNKPMNLGRKIYQKLREQHSSPFSYLYNTKEEVLLRELSKLKSKPNSKLR